MAENDEPTERDRGILSKADRAFLTGRKQDLSEQGKRDSRYRIRNRIEDGFYDLALLENTLNQRDRKLVFQNLEPQQLIPAFTFIYKGILDTSDSLEDSREVLEDIIETAVSHVYDRYDPEHIIEGVEVDIQVKKRRPDLEKIIENYRKGEDSLEEVRFLRQTDQFDGDESLLSDRMLKHMYNEGIVEEIVEKVILENSEFDSPSEYFKDADQKIAKEGRVEEDG